MLCEDVEHSNVTTVCQPAVSAASKGRQDDDENDDGSRAETTWPRQRQEAHGLCLTAVNVRPQSRAGAAARRSAVWVHCSVRMRGALRCAKATQGMTGVAGTRGR